MLDGVQLVCGDNSSLEWKEQTMRAGWASDPVHPNGHIYAKMALTLIEKIAPASNMSDAMATGSRKRTWSACTGMKASAARIDVAAEAAAVAGSVSMTAGTVGTQVMVDPVPDPATTRPPSGARPGNQEERVAAATAAAMAAATAAATAAVMAATKTPANGAEEAAGVAGETVTADLSKYQIVDVYSNH